MYKKYRVTLAPAERQELQQLIASGTLANAAHTHVRVLLKADTAPGAPAWTDGQISDAFDISIRSIVRIRQAFCQAGVTRAVHRKPPSGPRPRVVDGRLEAHIVALTCSAPPAGHERWTVRLLGQRLVELENVEHISHETVRQTLKKMNLSLG